MREDRDICETFLNNLVGGEGRFGKLQEVKIKPLLFAIRGKAERIIEMGTTQAEFLKKS